MSIAALGEPSVQKNRGKQDVVSLQFDTPTLADRISSVPESIVNGVRVFFKQKPIDLFKQGGNPDGSTNGNGCQLPGPSDVQIQNMLDRIHGKTME